MKKKSEDNFDGIVKLDGSKYSTFDSENNVLTDTKLGGKKIELQIDGKGTCYYYWQAAGIPRGFKIEEHDQGLRIRRQYLDRDGFPLDYRRVKQGELVVAELKMKAMDKNLDNVVIADLLPAGFEIENPRLESRADVPWIKDQDWSADYMDIRDDRLLLFASLPGGKERTFYYALRAVTVGEFTLPPISAECMYDPSYTSLASSGVISVVGVK